MFINAWLSGAIFMASMVIALFFYRYWRQSRDRLFIYFGLAFVLEGTQRLVQSWWPDATDVPQFSLRLVEYALILIAIVQKNRSSAGKKER